jgi:hypothetical protein
MGRRSNRRSEPGIAEAELELIGNRSRALAPSDPWHTVGAAGEPAYVNSWTDIDGGAHTRFKKIAGVVHVQIRVGGGVAALVFTLPAGYRPNIAVRATILDGIATCAVEVGTSGGVSIVASGGGADGKRRGSFSFPADE